jgi:hypothetical protein
MNYNPNFIRFFLLVKFKCNTNYGCGLNWELQNKWKHLILKGLKDSPNSPNCQKVIFSTT